MYTHIHTHENTCTRMFIQALFIIVKNWKQTICPSMGECINKLFAPMQLSVTQWYKEINCEPTKTTEKLKVNTAHNAKWEKPLWKVCFSEKSTTCLIIPIL